MNGAISFSGGKAVKDIFSPRSPIPYIPIPSIRPFRAHRALSCVNEPHKMRGTVFPSPCRAFYHIAPLFQLREGKTHSSDGTKHCPDLRSRRAATGIFILLARIIFFRRAMTPFCEHENNPRAHLGNFWYN